MNLIFFIVFLLSAIIISIVNPDMFFDSMLKASENALNLTTTLCIIYAVWLGLLQLLKDSGLMRKVSSLLKPINKRLFKIDDEEALEYISGNLSANILGIGGVATPLGIKAVERLDKLKNKEFTEGLFFIVNVTSLQILPTTVIALRKQYGSLLAYDIILPTLISSLVSTIIGVGLILIIYKIKGKKRCL